MSTNTHGQSKTCTDIVNGQNWLEQMSAHIERATLAARVAGKTHATTAEWFAARDDARKAEDAAIGHLAVAAGRMRRDSAATGRLLSLGWAWQPVACQWFAPAPTPLPPADPKLGAAVEQLEMLGWRWSHWAPGEKQHWVSPSLGKIDPRNVKAAEALTGLGWTWTGGEWREAPAVVPAEYNCAVSVLRDLGYVWQGVRGWKAPEAANFDPRNAEAAKMLEGLGLTWSARDGLWTGPVIAPVVGNPQAVRAAAVKVPRESSRPGTSAPPGLDEAIDELNRAVSQGQMPADPVRDAAREVARTMPGVLVTGEFGAALCKLREALGE